jgi:hypothetical protein
MLIPLKKTSPASGLRIPVHRFTSVVFPAPFGPIRIVILLSLAHKFTLFTATKPPKDLVNSFVSNKGLGSTFPLLAVKKVELGS